MKSFKVSAVIPSAGSGNRMGGVSKPNIRLLGKTLFEHVLGAFEDSFVDEIIVVCSEDNQESLKELASPFKKPIKFVLGGKTRAESVFNGIALTDENTDIICVHDCARPFITKEIIEETVMASLETGASCVCSPVVDTLKYIEPGTNIVITPKRDNLFAVQTPQCFKKQFYLHTCKVVDDISVYTDETSLLESVAIKVNYIKRTETNMKLTTVDDVPIAELLMKRKENLL